MGSKQAMIYLPDDGTWRPVPDKTLDEVLATFEGQERVIEVIDGVTTITVPIKGVGNVVLKLKEM